MTCDYNSARESRYRPIRETLGHVRRHQEGQELRHEPHSSTEVYHWQDNPRQGQADGALGGTLL